MNIKTLAFKSEIPDWTTYSDFSNYLTKENCKPFGKSNEFLIASDRQYMEVDGTRLNLCTGIILRTKDSRTLTTMEKNSQKFSVLTEELKAGTSLIDFNHFIINEANGMGLYQTYFHSVTLPYFMNILRKRFSKFSHTPAVKSIDKSKSDPFRCEQYITRENLITMVQEMRKISKIEYKVVAGAEDSTFATASNEIKYIRKTIAYDLKVSRLSQIISRITSALKGRDNNFDQVWVHGQSGEGEDIVYKLSNDYGYFAQHDYDMTARDIKLDSADVSKSLKSSQPICQMKQLVKNNHTVKSFFTH